MDIDESDTITRKEIAGTAADFDFDGSMAGDVDALFLELDRDEDGTVTYSEFRKAFKSFLKGLKSKGKRAAELRYCVLSKIKEVFVTGSKI